MAIDFAATNHVLKRSQGYGIRQASIQDLSSISAIENTTSAYPCSDRQLFDCIENTYVLNRITSRWVLPLLSLLKSG